MTPAGFNARAQPPQGPELGRPIPVEQLQALPIGAFPDGRGLPAGAGTARQGRILYQRHCQSCHGLEGSGGSAEALAGAGTELNMENPERTIGNYWPYATTLFDFNLRTMPMQAPGSLSAAQAYAVTAYLLYLNGLLEEDAALSAENLPRMRMPNRDGFIPIDVPDGSGEAQ